MQAAGGVGPKASRPAVVGQEAHVSVRGYYGSPMSRLDTWWRYFRQRGLMASASTFIHRYMYRSHRFVVTRAVLSGPPAADHAGDVVFRVATPSDLQRLDEAGLP